MSARDLGDDRETESGTAPRTARVEAAEPVERASDELRRDAVPLVPHVQRH